MSVFVDPDGTQWEPDPDPIETGKPGFIYSGREGKRVRRAMTAAERAESERHAAWYAAFMRSADLAWAGPVGALRHAGFNASVWQTGGMCLAIGADFGAGHHLMLTTVHESLAASPAEYVTSDELAEDRFWHLGLYVEAEDDGLPDSAEFHELDLDVTDRTHDAQLAAKVAELTAAYTAKHSQT